jgi:hypothetical protein
VAAARYDVAAGDGGRVAIVRDVHVDADTTVNVDLDTDGTALETFPAAVSGIQPHPEFVLAVVSYEPDEAVDDIITPGINLSAAFIGSGGSAQLAAMPPSAVGRTDAQWLFAWQVGTEAFVNGDVVNETVTMDTLDSHDVVFPAPPQLNVGNGKVAGTAIGSASSVSFDITTEQNQQSQTIGAVWMTRGWLDNQPDPSEAAFDTTIAAFAGSATLTVANLNVCTTTPTESVCSN